MKKVRFASFTAAVVLTTGIALHPDQAAAVPSIVNGGFEDPAIDPNTFVEVSTGATSTGARTLTGWTGSYIAGNAHEYLINGNIPNLSGDLYGTTPFGQQYLGLNAVYRNSFHSIMSQVVGGFTPGQAYTLTLYIADISGAGDPNVLVTASANSGTGATLASQTFTSPTDGRGPYGNGTINFVPFSLTFTPTTDTVSFSINNSSKTGTMGIDNVSVAAAVPEPTTLAGVLLGAGALVGAVRRKHQG